LRQTCRIACHRRKHLPAIAIRHQDDAAFAVLIEEALGDPAEALEIPVA
jgi:hypothetical protein